MNVNDLTLWGRQLRRHALQFRAIAADVRQRARHASMSSARATTKRYLETASPAALHLGCGPAVMAGWLNIDYGGKPQIARDLTEGLGFIPSASFDYAYTEHFLEHIERREAQELMLEVHRVLKPGGRIRIALPDLDLVVSMYHSAGKWQGHTEYINSTVEALHGRVFGTRGEWIDTAFHAWGHRYLYNFEDLSRLLSDAGFSAIDRVAIGESPDLFLRSRETRPADQSSLIVEANR